MSQENSTTGNEPVKLTVSGILNDLEQGLVREQIQEKYGLSTTDMGKLFQHPKLKGKKAKKAPGFILEDDTEEVLAQTPTPVGDVEVEQPETVESDNKEEPATEEVTDELFN